MYLHSTILAQPYTHLLSNPPSMSLILCPLVAPSLSLSFPLSHLLIPFLLVPSSLFYLFFTSLPSHFLNFPSSFLTLSLLHFLSFLFLPFSSCFFLLISSSSFLSCSLPVSHFIPPSPQYLSLAHAHIHLGVFFHINFFNLR